MKPRAPGAITVDAMGCRVRHLLTSRTPRIGPYTVTMLSIDRLKLLVRDPRYSESELEAIRVELHALAEIIFDKWRYETNTNEKRSVDCTAHSDIG